MASKLPAKIDKKAILSPRPYCDLRHIATVTKEPSIFELIVDLFKHFIRTLRGS